MLSTIADFEVVGEAESAATAIDAALVSVPDVILLDIHMKGQDGVQAARHLHRLAPKTHVVMLTVHDDPDYVSRALEAGASGYVLKTASSADLADSIRRITSGERVIPQELIAPLLDEYVTLVQTRTREEIDLSDDELRILNAMSTGMSYRSIAESLYLSEITVRRRVQNVYQKLEVSDRAEAVATAIRRGLI
jgi:DNA-binding NarL/FixJ family response regulator